MILRVETIRRRLRVIALLAGARRAGTAPLAIPELHALAYFADALSPVWDLQLLDPRLLKRARGPFSPALQADVDQLVGSGVVAPTRLEHVEDPDLGWRLDAAYRLHWPFASRILEEARRHERWDVEVRFVEEIVLAFAALPRDHLVAAVSTDAAYGDAEVAAGRLVDIARDEMHPNLTAQVAMRFRHLLEPEIRLQPAELIHLYARELDRRLSRVL